MDEQQLTRLIEAQEKVVQAWDEATRLVIVATAEFEQLYDEVGTGYARTGSTGPCDRWGQRNTAPRSGP